MGKVVLSRVALLREIQQWQKMFLTFSAWKVPLVSSEEAKEAAEQLTVHRAALRLS